MMQLDFVPLITGTDIFAYYWSRSIHQAFGVKSYLLGQTEMAFTSTSDIIEDIFYIPGLGQDDVFVPTVLEYAKHLKETHPGSKVVLVPTSDHYVQLVVNNRDKLAGHVLFHVPEKEIFDTLLIKEKFIPFAQEQGIPIPETYMVDIQSDIRIPSHMFPVIIKPSDGVEYYHHSFEGQEKVYRCEDDVSAQDVIQRIKKSGYPGQLILQEYIPGDDSYLWESNSYTNTEGQTQFVSLAQIALQEPEPTAVGNYTALITRYNKEVMDKIVDFVQRNNYTGFINVDMKWDEKSQQLKVFEFNLRSGRSAFYVDQAGESLARNLINDIVYDQRTNELNRINNKILSSFVPKGVLRQHVLNKPLLKEIDELIRENKYANPLKYHKDMNLRRRLYLFIRDINYYKKYKNGQWNQ